MNRALVVALFAACCGLGGCDSRATASEPRGAKGDRSHEFETCAASAQCADELRCFDHACRRTARSTVGDYYAAAGARKRGKGDLEGAINEYGQALARYESEKLALPPDVDCAYGATLATARSSKEHAELGARVLHRCVLAVPVGSKLREQALAELAELADAGLDPAVLGGSKLADVYLTRSPTRPAADKVVVTVTGTPTPAAKSFGLVADKLNEAETRTALVGCWSTYTAAAQKDALTVTANLKVTYIASDYEDEPGAFTVKLEPAGALAAGSPEAAADTCVRQVVEPALKAAKLSDAFATKLTLTIK